jgi:uncharacterized BrkB/YihY/UPF0761 family membrane protein
VIVLLFWLYMAGAILLLGSEIDFLVDKSRSVGKKSSNLWKRKGA